MCYLLFALVRLHAVVDLLVKLLRCAKADVQLKTLQFPTGMQVRASVDVCIFLNVSHSLLITTFPCKHSSVNLCLVPVTYVHCAFSLRRPDSSTRLVFVSDV